MSDPSEPKGPSDAPAEGPTKAFVFKIDGWLADLMSKDLGLDGDAPGGAPAASLPADVAPAPPDPEASSGKRAR